MAAEKNLPVAHVVTEAFQLESSDWLDGFKGRANVVRWTFGDVANQKRAAANERIYSFLLGEGVLGRLVRLRRRVHPLIITRPERKLIHQVLRLDDVDGRMPRTFDSFVF